MMKKILLSKQYVSELRFPLKFRYLMNVVEEDSGEDDDDLEEEEEEEEENHESEEATVKRRPNKGTKYLDSNF
jgi:hypothetical protein